MKTILELTPAEAAGRIDTLDVVDVRADHEFDGPLGHVPGARWIPLADLGARVEELRSNRPLLMVCRSGARSRRACEVLEALRIGPVFNLAGGMIDWNRAGLPIETSIPGSPAALVDSIVAWVSQVGRCERGTVRAALWARIQEIEGRSHASEPSATVPAPVERWTRARIELALEQVEAGFREGEIPPDLDLSLAAFRRWLSVF